MPHQLAGQVGQVLDARAADVRHATARTVVDHLGEREAHLAFIASLGVAAIWRDYVVIGA